MDVSSLNISGQEIVENAKANEAKFHINKRNFIKFPRPKNKEEFEIISSLSCKYPVRIEDIDHETLLSLMELVQSNFYDPAVMQLTACVFQAIYSGPREDINIIKIHNWLGELEIISEGANGKTFITNVDNLLEGKIVTKYPLRGNNLIHEVFVGLVGTNYLRQFIPNFSFVFGGFSCSPPVISKDTVYDYCISPCPSCPINYALYENIAPAKTWKESLDGATPEDFLNWYFQVILALQVANEKIGFTHFDLHVNNVLIREAEEATYIYPLERGNYPVTTSTIPTLIDYGFSSFVYKKKRYSDLGGLYGYLGDVNDFPLYDALKLLGTSYDVIAFAVNKPLLKIISSILRYFTSENPHDFVAKTIEYQFALPKTYAKLSLYGLIEHLVFLHPTVEHVTSNVKSCIYSDCFTEKELINETDIKSIKTPENIANLFIDLNSIPEGSESSFIRSLPRNIFEVFTKEFLDDVENLNHLISKLNPDNLFFTVARFREITENYEMFNSIYEEGLSFDFASINKAYFSINFDKLLEASRKRASEYKALPAKEKTPLVQAKITFLELK